MAIKYMCDVSGCGAEARHPDGDEWSSNEMVDVEVKGAGYFWARFGFADVTLCGKHRKEAVTSFIKNLTKKYDERSGEAPF